MTNLEKTPLEVKGFVSNNPTPIVGVPVWSVVDSSVLTLDVAADGLTAFAVSAAVGTTTVTVTHGALSASVELSVVEVAPDRLEIVVGTPVLK